MLDRGIRVTINSDDSVYFPGYMTENLVTAQHDAGLSRAELIQITRNAFDGAWLTDNERAPYLALLEDYAAS